MNHRTLGVRLKINKQNATYVESLLLGLYKYRYGALITENNLYRLEEEYKNEWRSGYKFGAVKGFWLAKRNSKRVIQKFDDKLKELQTAYKADRNNNRYIHGYTIMISPVSNAIIKTDNYGLLYWADNNGNNVYQTLLDAKTLINDKLRYQKNNNRDVSKSITGSLFNDYGLGFNIENVFKYYKKRAVNHVHAHSELIIDSEVDTFKLENEIKQLLKSLGVRFKVNINDIQVNYLNEDAEASLIDLNKPLVVQKKEIEAFETVFKYDNKQVGFPSYSRLIKTVNGREVTQLQELSALPYREQAKAVIATINSTYNKQLHTSTGLLRTGYDVEINEIKIKPLNFKLAFKINSDLKKIDSKKRPFDFTSWEPPP